MKYWIGINTEVQNVKEANIGHDTFWCLPDSSEIGDKVFLYCPRSASTKHQGVYALCSVLRKPVLGCKENYICNSFHYNGSTLLYTPLVVNKVYKKHLSARDIKDLPAMVDSALLKKNFQSTVFQLSEEQYQSLVSALTDINSRLNPEI